MANLGKGDPDRHRGARDPCRSAVDLHVDDDGGLVRSDDGRHAGHDGPGNDALAEGPGLQNASPSPLEMNKTPVMRAVFLVRFTDCARSQDVPLKSTSFVFTVPTVRPGAVW